MRWLALNNGAAAWLVPSLQPNQFTPFELFLICGVLLRTARSGKKGTELQLGMEDAVIQMQPWYLRPMAFLRTPPELVIPQSNPFNHDLLTESSCPARNNSLGQLFPQ